MNTVVTHVTFKDNRIDDATKELQAVVIPAAKSAKGFVSGIWSHDRDGTKGVGVILFETEPDASAFVSAVRSGQAPTNSAVNIESMEVFAVGGTA